ncbi:xanthine dehydrogenase family protein subunit M [Tropicibacter sp. R16_0]|uniref:FAD binding domain-containing protein n=1 Tax=Tropicibacter sp. R16_0 TaxID=2821102 RepID=UPI001AD9EFC0|nr:xanthine dehydrogenase family protein subunit M [Tropicibacter sp. R16_0]MBO9448851.1 xanthine dehydrogenase family protein subunit M [Tropicibacter sp. R16_0]
MARFQLGTRTLDYFSPTTLDDAFDRLSARNVDIVAGGTDFYPARPQGPLKTDLLDVTRIAGLSGITKTQDGWRIGAATRWSEVFRTDLSAAFEGLQASAREVGSLQIQNAGTVAGNLCNASPAADGVPPLLTLDAQVEIGSARGTRTVDLADFITGVRKTDLQDDELVTAILLPDPPSNARGAFEKLGSRRYLVISITMTASVIGLDADGRIDHARIAVGACSPVAQRLTALENDLLGKTVDQVEVTEAHLAPLSPIDDVRGSGEYRLDAVAEQCLRAIKQAGGKNG